MWGESVQISCYITNRCPTKGMDVTPAEKWFGKKPDIKHLKIFGTKVFAKVVKPLKKLDKRSKAAMIV